MDGTEASPPPPLPWAHPADLVRAYQKDEQCRGQLRRYLSELLEELLGHRRAAPWQALASVASDFSYAIATGVLSGRTLGEEYCELMVVAPEMRRASQRRRLASVMLFILPPLVIQWLTSGDATEVSARGRQGLLGKLAKALAKTSSVALRFHLAMFYIFGSYRLISDRIAGLRALSVSERPYRSLNFRPLGLMLLVQMAAQALAAFFEKRRLRRAEEEDAKALQAAKPSLSWVESSMDESSAIGGGSLELDEEGQPLCNICMCPAECATATTCGHIYCWDCIASWCAIKASCPLCRAASTPQQLLPLRHYQVPPPGDTREVTIL
eukprot:TRINITY_DN7167_c0_g1_i1.p1 TRINITY_DN7167_c0_g1~~TRINITY_DN7167_c0_g1_i1.p1  ORF type:complete len:325 (+),score=52.42 TRINITY_DN7167_c0_g1_i1:64-1038(+)